MSEQETLVKEVLIEEKKTVASLLKGLGLNPKLHAVLLDGRRANEEDILDPDSKIIILPKIRGG